MLNTLNTAEFAAAQKANLDAFVGLSAKTFEGFEQLATLNLQVFKASLGEAAQTGLTVLSLKDPQSLLAFQAGLLQPAAEKAAAYGRKVQDIVTTTQAAVGKSAADQLAGAQKSFVDAVDAAAKNAPEGATGGVAMFKSALAAASDAFDGLQKAGRQATAAAEANYAAVTDSVVKAASKGRRG